MYHLLVLKLLLESEILDPAISVDWLTNIFRILANGLNIWINTILLRGFR